MERDSFNFFDRTGRYFSCALILFFLLCTASPVYAVKGVYDWAFVKLDYMRQEKVDKLKTLCSRTHELALRVSEDPLVRASFDINLQFLYAGRRGTIPDELDKRVSELRKSFDSYYIENYFTFYNIMFIGTDGDIIYSTRKEPYPDNNLLTGDTKDSALSLCLKNKPQKEMFVDFQYWKPSNEPAAFFIEPLHKDGVHTGWIILQCAVNKFNTILALTEDLGQTGETFLVNRKGYMLTESNFKGSSTILKKRLDDRNIQAKFTEGHGHRTVTDYRGCVAFSSFEVVSFMGTTWLVVAKVDRDEIITQHYTRYRRYYAEKLLSYLKDSNLPPPSNPVPSFQKPAIRIDMDEFLKAGKGERLHTFGISTCTGLLAAYPGKFAYMAHISPMDRLYGKDETNLLGQMIKKIKSFDTYRSERRHVIFVLAAPHLESLLAAVDKLVEEGFLLAQIRVMYNSKADKAAMSYDYVSNELTVSWSTKNNPAEKTGYLMQDTRNVGEIIRSIMQSEEKSL